ncbi:hypothetical protein C8Q78DRAFT_79505 [Trametes maxima]|nr:hypothetical protein C8Q78DRAFT_79505 [Trametes maxima]
MRVGLHCSAVLDFLCLRCWHSAQPALRCSTVSRAACCGTPAIAIITFDVRTSWSFSVRLTLGMSYAASFAAGRWMRLFDGPMAAYKRRPFRELVTSFHLTWFRSVFPRDGRVIFSNEATNNSKVQS